jgi:outer membrane protein OmpA-like peptidoglycan-associated protein
MNKLKITIPALIVVILFTLGCASWNKTEKGAAIGTVGGAAAGAVIGKVAGNTALGAIIGATVGGVTGAVIGHKMDKQAEEMKKNIPDAKVERVGEGIVIEFTEKILFGFNESNLTSTAKKNLTKLVGIMSKYPDTNIEVQGHTDNKGTPAYNQALSERRALSVSTYLSANGISSSRLTIKGFGETVAKYDNSTKSGQAQNRRVEFLVTANEKMKSDAAKEAVK